MIKKKDWKTIPIPEKRKELGYQKFFWDSDAEKIMAGHKPASMDDKWFIYSESGWVYFVRSWTGHHIFAIQLAGSSSGGAKVVASWVNANPDEYQSPGNEADIQFIDSLIKSSFGVHGHA